MSRSALVLMMLVLTATGCVATRHAPLAEQDATSLTGKTLQRSVYQKPSFVTFTAGKARLGALGAVAMIGAGNEIVQDNAVQDPAFGTAEEIAEELSRKYDLGSLVSEPRISESDDVGALAKTYADADMILDVRTINRQFRQTARGRGGEELCSFKPQYADTSTAPPMTTS
jgi:hypothetical protein